MADAAAAARYRNTAVNVYLIEDNLNRQRLFLQVLAQVNRDAEARGLNVTLKPGFGEKAELAQDHSTTPQKLLEALLDESAMYIVDLTLLPPPPPKDAKRVTPKDTNLSALLKNRKEDWIVSGFRRYVELTTSTNILLSDFATKCPISVPFLCCCKAAEKKVILASAETAGKYIEAVKSLDLAVCPSGLSLENMDSIGIWSVALLGLIDELDRIKSRTSFWFGEDYDQTRWTDSLGLPHDLKDMPLLDHCRIVTSVFPWVPKVWWKNKTAAYALHENLKGVIGKQAEWMSDKASHPLSLGGAYFLLLIAVAQQFSADRLKTLLVKDWCMFVRDGRPLPFLPSQHGVVAERSVRSLYKLFCLIRSVKGNDALGIEAIIPPDKDNSELSIKLAWTKIQGEEFARAFVDRVIQNDEHEKLLLPSAKATSALVHIILLSHLRKTGIGPVASITFEDRMIRIG